MSATHLGCGCVINRDDEGLLVTVAPCPRHRWATQPELEALYQRVLDLRVLDAAKLEPTPPSVSDAPEAAAAELSAPYLDGPDIDVQWISEDPLLLVRRIL